MPLIMPLMPLRRDDAARGERFCCAIMRMRYFSVRYDAKMRACGAYAMPSVRTRVFTSRAMSPRLRAPVRAPFRLYLRHFSCCHYLLIYAMRACAIKIDIFHYIVIIHLLYAHYCLLFARKHHIMLPACKDAMSAPPLRLFCHH